MTDLVAQLVGALELCYDHCRLWHPDVEKNNVGESVRTALSAAKDGGWLAVQNKPVAYGIATERGAIHSVKTNLVSANKCAEKWRQKQAENGFADWRCHVVPLAPLPNPPKDQS